MNKKVPLAMAMIFVANTILPAYAATVPKVKDDFIAPLVESGLYKLDTVTNISADKSKVTLLDENNQIVTIDVEETTDSKTYTFKEGNLVTEIEFTGDEILLNNQPVNVSVNTKNIDNSNSSPRVTTETWLSNDEPFDNGPYRSKANMVKDINIEANRTIGAYALTALLALIGGNVATGLATFVGEIETFSELKDAVEALQKKAPNSKGLYLRETYYKSYQEDTSGRPLVYYYKVKVEFAKTQEFNSFYPETATYYRKQMIYA